MTLTVIIAGLTAIIVMGIGGVMTDVGPWYRDLNKPSWNPPNWLFGPAWAVILGLAAWAGALAWLHATPAPQRDTIIALFGVNIGFQLAWSPLFFNLRRPDWALIEVPFLWLSVMALIIALTPISPLSGLLLTPYALWVAFATILNAMIVRMNPPFSGQARGKKAA